jgi:hypothetical protein
MITKCFNPACQAPFDHRAGRLVRFSTTNANNNGPGSQPFIQHFWICGPCAKLYRFECKSGMPVELIQFEKAIPKEDPSFLLFVA